MEEQSRVVLLGDSLILAGLQTSLNLSPNLEAIVLKEPPASLAEVLRDLHPAAVIFDLGSTCTDFPLALLRQPDLLLIGVDPGSNAAIVFGRLTQTLHMTDLLSLLLQQEADIPTFL